MDTIHVTIVPCFTCDRFEMLNAITFYAFSPVSSLRWGCTPRPWLTWLSTLEQPGSGQNNKTTGVVF